MLCAGESFANKAMSPKIRKLFSMREYLRLQYISIADRLTMVRCNDIIHLHGLVSIFIAENCMHAKGHKDKKEEI